MGFGEAEGLGAAVLSKSDTVAVLLLLWQGRLCTVPDLRTSLLTSASKGKFKNCDYYRIIGRREGHIEETKCSVLFLVSEFCHTY